MAAKRKPIGTPKTQRLRKLECETACGYIAYVSRRWIAHGLPSCACGARLWPADLEDAAAVLSREELERHPAYLEYVQAAESVNHGQLPRVKSGRGADYRMDLHGAVARKLEESRRESARARQLAAIRPASDPIPF